MIRSVLAILTGIVVLTVASFTIEAVANPLMRWMFSDVLSNETTINHDVPARLLMLVYTTLCVAGGGYVAAWVAGCSEVRHAVIMGTIQLAMTVGALIALPGNAPLWFWIAGMALMVPAAWCGGIIRAKRATVGN
jgi:hypothetical protein